MFFSKQSIEVCFLCHWLLFLSTVGRLSAMQQPPLPATRGRHSADSRTLFRPVCCSVAASLEASWQVPTLFSWLTRIFGQLLTVFIPVWLAFVESDSRSTCWACMSLGLLAHILSCTWHRRVCVLVLTVVLVLLQRLYFLSQQLPVITSNTIVRCRSCRTYINPFVSFIDQRRWKCNLCYRVNDGECRRHCMTPFSVVFLLIAFNSAFKTCNGENTDKGAFSLISGEMGQSKTKQNEMSL